MPGWLSEILPYIAAFGGIFTAIIGFHFIMFVATTYLPVVRWFGGSRWRLRNAAVLLVALLLGYLSYQLIIWMVERHYERQANEIVLTPEQMEQRLLQALEENANDGGK